jgi:hypothetical protein
MQHASVLHVACRMPDAGCQLLQAVCRMHVHCMLHGLCCTLPACATDRTLRKEARAVCFWVWALRCLFVVCCLLPQLL